MMDLSSIKDRAVKTKALESAYDSGFTGCFLRNDHGPEGAQARYESDAFRDTVGKSRSAFTAATRAGIRRGGHNGIEGCHVYTSLAPAEFRKHNAGYPDTIGKMYQNSGCCVGASWKELMDFLMGCLSANPANQSIMAACCSMIVYSYRSGCGQGWYMGSCAREAVKHGWLPAVIFDGRKLGELVVPTYQNVQSDDEGELEKLATSTWCNDRVPDILESWMAEHFRYEEGAITELDDASESTIKAACEQQACFHHGSNYTASSGGLGGVRRIGGHAQTGYGGDWSPQCIEWFSKLGVKCSESNFIMPQGQTWGPNWSGSISPSKWPYGSDSNGRVITQSDVNAASSDPPRLQDLLKSMEGHWGWGQQPEGSWIVTRETFARYFASECYVYLPKFGGIPGKKIPVPPIPEPASITVTCEGLRPDVWSPMRGSLVVEADGKAQRFILTPDGAGNYKAVPMQT